MCDRLAVTLLHPPRHEHARQHVFAWVWNNTRGCLSDVPSVPEVVGENGAELALVRRKLQGTLQSSASYDMPLLLSRLVGTRLWEEQVILFAKVGKPQRCPAACLGRSACPPARRVSRPCVPPRLPHCPPPPSSVARPDGQACDGELAVGCASVEGLGFLGV